MGPARRCGSAGAARERRGRHAAAHARLHRPRKAGVTKANCPQSHRAIHIHLTASCTGSSAAHLHLAGQRLGTGRRSSSNKLHATQSTKTTRDVLENPTCISLGSAEQTGRTLQHTKHERQCGLPPTNAHLHLAGQRRVMRRAEQQQQTAGDVIDKKYRRRMKNPPASRWAVPSRRAG